jgi:hypothetical protein
MVTPRAKILRSFLEATVDQSHPTCAPAGGGLMLLAELAAEALPRTAVDL